MSANPSVVPRATIAQPDSSSSPVPFAGSIRPRPQIETRHGELESGGDDGPIGPPRPIAWFSLVTAGTLLLAAVGGAIVLRTIDAGAAPSFVEIFVTDLPADFERLDVHVSAVYVGAQNHALRLDRASFDLLALHGPGGALRLASGMVPAEDDQEIRIVFRSARATLDRQTIEVDVPRGVLAVGHDFGFAAGGTRALLFDIDVNESLTIVGSRIEFRPYVESVYLHSYGALPSPSKPLHEAPWGTTVAASHAPPDFEAAPAEPPQTQALEEPSQEMASSPPATEAPRPAPANETGSPGAARTSDPAGNESSNESSRQAEPGGGANGALPTMGDAATVPQDYATHVAGWFVQFQPDVDTPEEMMASLDAHGAELVYRFGSVPAAYVMATPLEAESLYFSPDVEHVEPDVSVQPLLASSKTAIRLPEVLNPVAGLRDAYGNVLDGRGVAVAVIDTGVDGLHPDLAHRQLEGANAVLTGNYKVASLFAADLVYTDWTSGHGTHVTGILAGQGKKDASLRGVAPGVKVWGLGIGELSTTLWPNQALDWVLLNHNKVSPPIKVVTNSWGSGTFYDPNSLTTRLVNDLVARGITVVFAAGNGKGDGSVATTTSQCQIPTPGVLCVAAYDDGDVGDRNGKVPDFSSRGRISDPATWPDLAAPGTSVRSARTPFGWVTGVGLLDYYVSLSGTSMAAPHVAGVAAMMLQARPGLSPAQIETILESTAYKFTDLGAYNANGAHHAKGSGLLDAYAAIQGANQI